VSDRYARYQRLQFDWPAPRVLRIRMNNPGKLNAADQTMHGELAAIWRDVDEDRVLRRRRHGDDRRHHE
jgi:enoyl-CoA hydratase